MKKILVVGFMPYGYKEKLVEKYPDVIWFEEREVGMSYKAAALVEVVKMMDGVMFMGERKDERIPYEIVCALGEKQTWEKAEWPVEEKEAENGKSV